MRNNLLEQGIKKLGFGFMRLPRKNGEFDDELINKMVDTFLDKGYTYFDTAYVYEGSEQALSRSLVKRHPRETYQIATKLNPHTVEKKEELSERFNTSLERLGVSYVDLLLLHGLNAKSNAKFEELGAWEYGLRLKADGIIRHLGFSFHGPASELDEILTKHPEAEFVQLQINYLDWDDGKVDSQGQYEVARRHGVPIVIMEPIKGGMLASADSAATKVLKATNPNVSAASWAMRFAASLDGVLTVLSGMGSLEQMTDNIKTIETLTPLSEDEIATVKKAVKVLRSIPRIPCTSCEYCIKGCPAQIKIPALMDIYSNYLVYNTTANVDHVYGFTTRGSGRASDCVSCRACEGICPQGIEIVDTLSKLAELFDK